MLPNSTTTKDKILNLIKENNQMTIIEISQQINITEMAVRRHIEVLENDGFITTVMRKNQKGRPSKAFELTEQGEECFPQMYKQIGMELLQEINRIDSSIIDHAIVMRHNRLVNRFRNRIEGKSFEEQVNEIAKIQSELGFMAEVTEIGTKEKKATIKQRNCPYYDIAKDYPDICTMEQKFYKELLQTEDVHKISSMSKGDSCCHYMIGTNKEAL
ncbi:helix-turn-helix transcriptional regulator [Neobacillus sp. D3-1R]|uniref:helix-turn-helix transcriptional regulator n=1 Tax=Neobacillus sp. D3-1R TaxID=3445778 RepID=UPI003F9FBFB3